MSTTTLTNTLQHMDSVLLRSVTPTTFNIIRSQQEDQAAVLSILTTATTLETTTTTTAPAIPITTIQASTSDYEEESDEEEKDLTNLTWLTELRNQTISWPNAINPPLDDDKDASRNDALLSDYLVGEAVVGDDAIGQDKSHHSAGVARSKGLKSKAGKNVGSAVQQQHQQQQAKRPTPAERFEMFLDKVKHDLAEYTQSASNYQIDTSEKPPFNYSHIIGMAMLENGRVTLQQICSWIEAKFAFFRVRKKWNNSIRHNLSLHHCFRKIDRNKYEKGKGGYWELGVDPKKCDRKRIRNRKSAQNKNKLLQANSKTTTTTARNPTITTTSYNFDGSNMLNTPMESDDMSTIASGMETTEELLLDEMDVQQNIDVSSCSHQQQQQQHLLEQQQQQQLQVEDIFIANIFTQAVQDDDASATTAATMINAADLPGLATLSGSDTDNNILQHQQYQLGTIIISASAADVAAATSTFNCLINDTYNNNSAHQQQQNVLYTEDDIPSACENVIVSSYLANTAAGNLDEFSIDANNPIKQIMHNVTSSNTIPYSQRPNVIVEPLEQPSQAQYAIGGASSSNAALVAGNNCDYSNIVGDNFRPYIDGIEEAFQYLRSMDNNREDILDNLLDISVSDY